MTPEELAAVRARTGLKSVIPAILNAETVDQFAHLIEESDDDREQLLAHIDALTAVLGDANRIIAMTRRHLNDDHPDCAYAGLGVLNDASREALAHLSAPTGRTGG